MLFGTWCRRRMLLCFMKIYMDLLVERESFCWYMRILIFVFRVGISSMKIACSQDLQECLNFPLYCHVGGFFPFHSYLLAFSLSHFFLPCFLSFFSSVFFSERFMYSMFDLYTLYIRFSCHRFLVFKIDSYAMMTTRKQDLLVVLCWAVNALAIWSWCICYMFTKEHVDASLWIEFLLQLTIRDMCWTLENYLSISFHELINITINARCTCCK